jgi:hypothetical protein
VTLRVLAFIRYQWRFNGPKRSRLLIENCISHSFDYVTPELEGVTAGLLNWRRPLQRPMLRSPDIPPQWDVVFAVAGDIR